MIHHQRTLVIDASPKAVWGVLGRFMHIDEFAPFVETVEALTSGDDQVGSKRRCHFTDGSAMVEEVTEWEANRRYRVRLSETDPMPLKVAYAELSIRPHGIGQTHVEWSMDYQVKYGPFGWLLGQTMMKIMMGKILVANLNGLAKRVKTNQTAGMQSS